MPTKEHACDLPACQSGKKPTPANLPAPAVHKQLSQAQTGPKTRITIFYDVGFSNAIYLRGNGANLSWDKGVLLKNSTTDLWSWETSVPFTSCEFKVLINDTEFEIGDNHILSCGATIQYTPLFH